MTHTAPPDPDNLAHDDDEDAREVQPTTRVETSEPVEVRPQDDERADDDDLDDDDDDDDSDDRNER